MTDPDAYDKVTSAFADLSERLVAYADVWRSAIDRNAQGAYAADDLLVDMQAVWGMGVRDAARIGAALVEVVAPLVPSDMFTSDGGPDGGSEPDEV